MQDMRPLSFEKGQVVFHSAALQKLANAFGSGLLEIRDAVWGEDKWSVWEEADYFLNLYRFAGIALAPCEAIGTGLPLLASREGNLGDWAAEAEMGWSVPLDSHKLYALFSRILNLSETDYLRLSGNAWKFAQDNSWNHVSRKMLNQYESTLNQFTHSAVH